MWYIFFKIIVRKEILYENVGRIMFGGIMGINRVILLSGFLGWGKYS